jgi:hypothetical protein
VDSTKRIEYFYQNTATRVEVKEKTLLGNFASINGLLKGFVSFVLLKTNVWSWKRLLGM